MKLLFPSFLSLCLALSVSFLSCKKALDVKGEYKMSVDELELPDDQAALMKQMADDFKLVLGEDNKLSFTMMGQAVEGTYKLDGTTLEFSMEGNTEKATIDGNKIMMEADGQKMVFIKSSK